MSKTITRRDAVTALAAAPAALAATQAPALAAANPAANDAELLRLFAEYRAAVEEYVARKKISDQAHAAFLSEMPPCPPGVRPGDHWRAHEPLYHASGAEATYDAWIETSEWMHATIAKIRGTEAHGLVGVAVKLATVEPEFTEDEIANAAAAAADDARAALARLTELDPIGRHVADALRAILAEGGAA